MACPDENRFVALLQGELEGEELEAIEAHIEGCPGCMATLVELAKIFEFEAPPDLAEEASLGTVDPLLDGANAQDNDRYQIIDRIGEGGMGIVYRALDTRLERHVALKVLRPDLEDEARRAANSARLEQEARLLAGLSHPNVLTVHDVGRWGDRVYLAAEFIQGMTLREWVINEEPSWQQILEIYIQAGQGLAAAHEAGLVHRDIKPDNILIGEDGRVRVTDFGLARDTSLERVLGPELGVDSQVGEDLLRSTPGRDPQHSTGRPLPFTRTGEIFGTPAYMSPEQHQSLPADQASDQFSFCVALFEALHERRPFEGQSFAELNAAKAQGAIANGVLKEIPQALEALIERGLNPTPQLRHQSMRALVNDLAAVLDASRRPKARVHPGRYFALVALVLVAVLGGVAYLGVRSSPRARMSSPIRLAEEPKEPEVAAAARECGLDERYSALSESCVAQSLCGAKAFLSDNECRPIPPEHLSQTQACRAGDTVLCLALGEELFDAELEIEAQLAVELLDRACAAGSAKGCYLLGAAIDNERQVELYEQACDWGNHMACNDFALQLMESGDEAARSRAVEIFGVACDKGLTVACYNYATCFASASGVATDMERARAIHVNACDWGHADSCSWLGSYHSNGIHIERAMSLSTTYFEKACDLGEAKACQYLGVRYYEGVGRDKDMDRALEIFEKACDLDKSESCWNAALMLKLGQGVPKDEAQGRAYLVKGCEGGYAKPCYFEGRYRVVEGREVEAVGLFGQACEGEYAPACLELARLYFRGQGLERDRNEAQVLAHKACELGELEGCLQRAQWHLEGPVKDINDGLDELSGLCQNYYYGAACVSLGEVYEAITRGQRAPLHLQALSEISSPPGDEAQRLYRKGCELGVAAGCDKLEALGQQAP